jgi:hypothetical protein
MTVNTTALVSMSFGKVRHPNASATKECRVNLGAMRAPALQAKKVDSSRRMEAVRTRSGYRGQAKHGSLVMAKKQGGGKLLPLPFTTLGELVAHWLEAKVYCSCCYEHCPIDAAAEQLRLKVMRVDDGLAFLRPKAYPNSHRNTVCGSARVVPST